MLLLLSKKNYFTYYYFKDYIIDITTISFANHRFLITSAKHKGHKNTAAAIQVRKMNPSLVGSSVATSELNVVAVVDLVL